MKIDLTEFSVDELVLQVDNTESLWRKRKQPDFLSVISQIYIYTDEQLQALKADLESEDL